MACGLWLNGAVNPDVQLLAIEPSSHDSGARMRYTFQLNGRPVAAESWDPAQPLLYVLRNQFGLHGAKFGCGLGQCGACTVLMDDRAIRSCSTPISRAAGRRLTTIEGLAAMKPSPLPDAFAAEQAAQ